jgi:AbiV family abortive infection protein
MRPRAIADLTQLTDAAFLEQVSVGMQAVVRNARGLFEDAHELWRIGRHRAGEILAKFAEEEGAKYHILLDAVRCPRDGDALVRQLRRFNDHLAKGLYAEYLSIAPASYGEVLEFLERERRSLYLDGPNDVDWIFRNSILRDREEAIYVDYVDDGGTHSWLEPRRPVTAKFPLVEPRSISLASRLQAAGFGQPDSLAVVAKIWRGITFVPGDHWQRCNELNLQTIAALNERKLLTREGAAEARRLAWDWLFPLHAADLTEIPVARKDLEAIQEAWSPEY